MSPVCDVVLFNTPVSRKTSPVCDEVHPDALVVGDTAMLLPVNRRLVSQWRVRSHRSDSPGRPKAGTVAPTGVTLCNEEQRSRDGLEVCGGVKTDSTLSMSHKTEGVDKIFPLDSVTREELTMKRRDSTLTDLFEPIITPTQCNLANLKIPFYKCSTTRTLIKEMESLWRIAAEWSDTNRYTV